jgi:hypothetical protein
MSGAACCALSQAAPAVGRIAWPCIEKELLDERSR